MEASAIPASVGLGRTRIAFGASLLRIRTDDQLVAVFREGNDEAFRVIHDRYRARMLAYARQMLGSSGRDPEDAVQDIFLRAYHGLRASDQALTLRAWLYRIAHNRCIDDLRRAQPLAIEAIHPPASGTQDPVAKVEQRDALRRLIRDVQQLPGQQRSALLMRELSGMSYSDVSGALGVTVPAVKSLLVRARVGLAQASEARNTACSEIRADLILAHDRGVRTSGLARRHLRECSGCREFRTEVRGVSRQLSALAPTLGPLGVIANLLGLGGGGGGAAAGGGAVAAGGSLAAAGGSMTAAGSAGLLAGGAGHVVTLLAAAVVTAGGAVEIQKSLTPTAPHPSPRRHVVARPHPPAPAWREAAPLDGGVPLASIAGGSSGTPGAGQAAALGLVPTDGSGATLPGDPQHWVPITMLLDPDMYSPQGLGPAPLAPAPRAPRPSPAGSATATGPTPTPAPGSAAATGTETGPASPSATGGASPGSASGSGASATTSTPSGTASGSIPSPTPSGSAATSSPTPDSGSSPAPGTSTSPTSAAATSPSSVGRSTTSAGTGSVVTLVVHRRSRRHHPLLGLSTP